MTDRAKAAVRDAVERGEIAPGTCAALYGPALTLFASVADLDAQHDEATAAGDHQRAAYLANQMQARRE